MAALDNAGRVIHGGDGGKIDQAGLGESIIAGAQRHIQIVDALTVDGEERKAYAAVSQNDDRAWSLGNVTLTRQPPPSSTPEKSNGSP